jgi:transcriptional regulator with XRE-family HTH domain
MEVGKRIRFIRKQQKRTQEEIAELCGFTKSLLSKIETGATMPPVATLMKIAEALGVRVSDLLEEESESGTVYTTAEQCENNAKWIKTNKGYSFFAFASEKRNKIMQPYLFKAKKNEIRHHVLSHEGEEFVYMLKGTLKYKVGSVEYTLHEGDSIYFNSLEEHMITPVTDVVYLAVIADKRTARGNDQ